MFWVLYFHRNFRFNFFILQFFLQKKVAATYSFFFDFTDVFTA